MEQSYGILDEKLTSIKERVGEHDVMLKCHDDKIEKLQTNEATLKTDVKNLIKSVDGLVGTIKWSVMACLTFISCIAGYVGFFVK